MNQRRALLATVALGLPAALAACATSTPSDGTSVQKVFNTIQYILPLVDVLAAGIAIAVPASAPVMTAASATLQLAGPVFQKLSTTMTEVEAKPLVDQIRGYVKASVGSIADVVNAAPDGSSLARFRPQVQMANAVVGLLDAFVAGVQAAPKGAVAMPLLHR